MGKIIEKLIENKSYFNENDEQITIKNTVIQNKIDSTVGTPIVELMNKDGEIVRREKVENAYFAIPTLENSTSYWETSNANKSMDLKNEANLFILLDEKTREENPNGVPIINTNIKGYVNLKNEYTGSDDRQGTINKDLSVFNKMENNYLLNKYVVDFNYEKANGTIKDIFLQYVNNTTTTSVPLQIKTFNQFSRRIATIPVDTNNYYIYPVFYKSFKSNNYIGMVFFGSNIVQYTTGTTKKYYMLKTLQGNENDYSYLEVTGLDSLLDGNFGVGKNTITDNIIIFNKDNYTYNKIDFKFDGGTKTINENYTEVSGEIIETKTLDISLIPTSGDTLVLKNLEINVDFMYAFFLGKTSKKGYLVKYTTEGNYVQYWKTDDILYSTTNNIYYCTSSIYFANNIPYVRIDVSGANITTPFYSDRIETIYVAKENEILAKDEFVNEKRTDATYNLVTQQIKPNYPIGITIGKQTDKNEISLCITYCSNNALSHAQLTNAINKTNEYTMRITWEIRTYSNVLNALFEGIL